MPPVEIPDPPAVGRKNPAVSGLDWGIAALAALSTGEKVVGTQSLSGRSKKVIADRGAGKFRRQLEYKAEQRGKMVIVVGRWYPSCKTGSDGGYKIPKVPLSVRAWTYPQCQAPHDRDINPASNWQKVAESSVSGSSPVST